MSIVGAVLVVISILIIYYVYDGYGRLLSVLCPAHKINSGRRGDVISSFPDISVILAAYNEELRIASKLEDILSQAYPGNCEIIVVSDGSTDHTNHIVQSYSDKGVRLVRTEGRVGKSLAQNEAVKIANGKILILTDTAVEMAPQCLERLVAPFSSSSVGCTTGTLHFKTSAESVVSEEQGQYWSYETKLRRLESCLGILAVAAGPLMAVKRSLWKPLMNWYGDDCVIPLDVVLSSHSVIQVDDAIAWDESYRTVKHEFKARIRMTVRNWQGTLSRSELLNPFKHPLYSFALTSHKLLRWLSPLWLVSFLLGIGLMYAGGMFSNAFGYTVAFMVLVLLALSLVLLGLGKRLPGVSVLASFLMVNAAFGIGLVMALYGKRIGAYQNK